MTKKKWGNAAWGFRKLDLEDQLSITADLGFSIHELGIANSEKDLPLDVTKDDLRDVLSLYRKYGIDLFCAATGNDFTEEDAKNCQALEKVEKVIDICSCLGVSCLRIFSGFTPLTGIDDQRFYKMIDCLNLTADYGKEKHVIPAIETHGSVIGYEDGVVHCESTSTNLKTLDCIFNKVRAPLGLVYDPANLYAQGMTHPEMICKEFGEKISYVHLKDFQLLDSGHLRPSACGKGGMKWDEILEYLSRIDVPWLIEYENTEDILEGTQTSYDYIKQRINQKKQREQEYGIIIKLKPEIPLIWGFPAFFVTSLLLVQCSFSVLLYFYGCKPFHLFPLIYAP